jgi:hypothetical protein
MINKTIYDASTVENLMENLIYSDSHNNTKNFSLIPSLQNILSASIESRRVIEILENQGKLPKP